MGVDLPVPSSKSVTHSHGNRSAYTRPTTHDYSLSRDVTNNNGCYWWYFGTNKLKASLRPAIVVLSVGNPWYRELGVKDLQALHLAAWAWLGARCRWLGLVAWWRGGSIGRASDSRFCDISDASSNPVRSTSKKI